MIVFFITASTITSYKDFKKLFWYLMYSLLLVLIYGLGQRFLDWPAVSTMNPEFARGHLLILTPEARLSATFAGHYDLAAYLVLLMPIVWGAYYSYKKKWLLGLASFISIVILFFTSSRVSFGAFVVSVPLMLLFLKKYRMFFVVVIFSLLMMYFSKDMTNRWLKTIQIKQILVDDLTGQVFVPQKMTSKELPAGSAYVQIGTEKAVISTNSSNYKQEMIDKALYEANVAKGMQGLSASETASITKSVNDLTAVNTVVTDISSATRFQVEWPRAINALLKNPLLGTGPSSITESTDNDYLRWLGEFGLLGFGTFLLILYKVAEMIFMNIKKMKPNIQPLFYGYLFGLFALLVNATYIDVFEASKVAYVFWYTTGIFIGLLTVPNIISELNKEK
jgi:O-antigen ligase